MFEEWGGKRYNSFGVHLRRLFGERVHRVSLDAGFTCPNRDGTLGTGGCIFCDAGGSRAGYVNPEIPVEEQLRSGMEIISKTTGAKKFIAYFQAFSNTYAPPETLETLYNSVLKFPDVVGIAISTRPDLVPDEILDLIEKIAVQKYVWLELGIQTMKEETLRRLNRGHGVQQNIDAIRRAKLRPHINILAHMILGLPDETDTEIIMNARMISELGVHGVKMHHLYVVENTVLADLYREGKAKVYEEVEDYAHIAVRFLENLRPDIIVHRLHGFATSCLIAPSWTSNRFLGTQKIEELLNKYNTYQGKYYNSPHF